MVLVFMGRTNPTYRNQLENIKTEWNSYRDVLRRENKEYFDVLFEYAEKNADAASHQNHRNHMISILFSIALEQEKQINSLQRRISELED